MTVANLPGFMHAYAKQIIEILIEPKVLANQNVAFHAKKVFSALTLIKPRLLVPAVVEVNCQQLPTAVCKLHEFVGQVVCLMDVEKIEVHLEVIFKYFVEALDYRRNVSVGRKESLFLDFEVSEDEIRMVEESHKNSIIRILFKLKEKHLKIFISKLLSHSKKNEIYETEKEPSQNLFNTNHLNRCISFYFLLEKIVENLKNIAAPYAAQILLEAMKILKASAQLKITGQSNETKKRKLNKKTGNEIDCENGEKTLKVCTSILNLLALFLKFDSDDGRLMKSGEFPGEIFATLSSQFESKLSLSLKSHSEFMRSVVAPCVAKLAKLLNDSNQLKVLVSGVLMKMRDLNWEVRFGAVVALEACFKEVSFEMVPLLPECLPYFSEGLEDENQRVQEVTKNLIGYIEDVLGESVEEYLT
eukprot:CAMPEP_0171470970 /NCGR_PEP_ID=MMETSP0946-20130122/439_1 /TAXON_ID=109269 /ORGANISM="Vaucheria litorea, Strain CCMP2940" /LENGTH=415 /DNA_ID=CAMNT_0012000397 /DNA_START=1629 /DNA_END=2876 /DNA_ORIENTATION=+